MYAYFILQNIWIKFTDISISSAILSTRTPHVAYQLRVMEIFRRVTCSLHLERTAARNDAQTKCAVVQPSCFRSAELDSLRTICLQPQTQLAEVAWWSSVRRKTILSSTHAVISWPDKEIQPVWFQAQSRNLSVNFSYRDWITGPSFLVVSFLVFCGKVVYRTVNVPVCIVSVSWSGTQSWGIWIFTNFFSVAWVSEGTIPTERPPLVDEVSANRLRLEGATWSAWRIPTTVSSDF
jgi:hypothetical protein